MMERIVTVNVVEHANLAWLESLGWTVKLRPDIAPGDLRVGHAEGFVPEIAA